jgi:transposase
LIEAFAIGLSALSAAKYAEVHRNTAQKFFMKLRLKIAEVSSEAERKLSGEIELDESYFGGKRPGRRGRGAADKQIVFGILERGGLVRIVPVEDVTAATLMEEVTTHTEKGCVYYTDQFRSYQSLKRFGKHYQIRHDHRCYARGKNHINGIEGFWSYAKKWLAKFNGVAPHNFFFYLKEIEWRYNHRKHIDIKLLLHKLI